MISFALCCVRWRLHPIFRAFQRRPPKSKKPLYSLFSLNFLVKSWNWLYFNNKAGIQETRKSKKVKRSEAKRSLCGKQARLLLLRWESFGFPPFDWSLPQAIFIVVWPVIIIGWIFLTVLRLRPRCFIFRLMTYPNDQWLFRNQSNGVLIGWCDSFWHALA